MRTENHHKVEAVLFAVGRDIAIEDIAGLCGISPEQAATILNELRQEYNGNPGNALMLHEKGMFWKFSVKDKYLPLVTSLVEGTELDKSTMETLAVIAWKYPVLQSEVIKVRHNKAYDHMKLLEERGFLVKERSGRSYRIRLTDKFFEYFDLPSKDAKEAFRKVIPAEIQREVEQSEQEIAAKEKEIEERARQRSEQLAQKRETEKSVEEAAKEAADAVDAEAGAARGSEDRDDKPDDESDEGEEDDDGDAEDEEGDDGGSDSEAEQERDRAHPEEGAGPGKNSSDAKERQP